MKVLLLGPYPPPQGGVQTHIVALRTYLRARGVDCSVINLTRHRYPETDQVYYPRHALDVLRHLVRARYDIMHLHIGGTLPRRLLALGLICCALPWGKTVLTFHSGGYPSSAAAKTAGRRTLRGVVLRKFDAVIGVNRALFELFSVFGCERERIHLIAPYAFQQIRFEDDAPRLPERLHRFFAAHNPVLLTVGLLEPEYNLPLQIRTLNVLRRTLPGAGLMIAGSGSIEAELRAEIAAAPCADHVALVGDVPHGDTLTAIARCDVLLRTTDYDGDSMAVREALSLGTRVVATDNGMRPAGVRLVPVGDEAALRHAIEDALAGPAHASAAKADVANLDSVYALYRALVRA